ncbi:MAG: hypothetical protein R3E68_15290 [Burkholderiaceae bacterium]
MSVWLEYSPEQKERAANRLRIENLLFNAQFSRGHSEASQILVLAAESDPSFQRFIRLATG